MLYHHLYNGLFSFYHCHLCLMLGPNWFNHDHLFLHNGHLLQKKQKTKKSLPELSKEVIADKVLIKSLENYVSAGDRSLLNITRFNDITEVNVSYDIKTKMNEMPECEEVFKSCWTQSW